MLRQVLPYPGCVENFFAPVIASLDRASRAGRGDLKLRGSNGFEIAALRCPASRQALSARNDMECGFLNNPLGAGCDLTPFVGSI